MNNEELVAKIREMAPWHHDIQINEEISTGKVFSPSGTLKVAENQGVSLISTRKSFLNQLKSIYPDGVAGKRFLDCACNAGGYCFWAVEAGFDSAYGFDVRDHWIRQGKLVKQERSEDLPSKQVHLETMDLYDLPTKDVGEFDMTYFSGIFYHLPDPVTGLKIAADRTTDVLYLNTAMMNPVDDEDETSQPTGMTMTMERTDTLMTGVHKLSWFPNNPQTLIGILKWLGFEDIVITMDNRKNVPTCNFRGEAKKRAEKNKIRRRRIGMYAARQKGRLDEVRKHHQSTGGVEVAS